MANEFLSAEVIAAQAVGLLERETMLAQLVTRLSGTDFAGAKGDTITMRVPAYLEAREYELRNDRSDPIEIDEIAETAIKVTLDRMLYSGVALTDENLTLDIRSFGEQVTGPQSRAMVRGMEQLVADAIESADIAFTINESDPYLAAAKARSQLNKNSIPLAGRALLLGSDTEIAFLSSPLLVRADTSGSTSALREAQIGRIAGMDTYVSQFIDPEAAYAIHVSAFGLANLAPVVPDGVTSGGATTYNGFATRWIRDYDAMFLRDRSVLSSLIGCSSVDDGHQLGEDHEGENVRVVKLEGIGA